MQDLYSMPGHLIRRCQQISVAIFLEECEKFGIRPVEFAVLSALEAVPNIDQITLSGLVAVDRTSIGRIVDKLERQGYLSRKNSAKDRRAKLLCLSKKGKALLRNISPSIARVQDRILEPLSGAQKKQFLASLVRICDTSNLISRAPMITKTS